MTDPVVVCLSRSGEATAWCVAEILGAAVHGRMERVDRAHAYFDNALDHVRMLFVSGTPVVGGLASWQGLEFVRGLEPLQLIGMDVVEVAPAYDHAEITAIAAASVAYDWLAILAKQRGVISAPVGRF